MSTTDQTIEEFMDTVTGFDRLALKKEFGAPLAQLANEDPEIFMYALVFLHMKHDGANDADAKNKALSLPQSELMGYFSTDEEANPEEPDTESGKEGLTAA